MYMLSADKLTERQKKILECIREFSDSHGYPPTVREIGTVVGLSSSSSVQFHLNKLAEAGLINKGNELNRSITLPARAHKQSVTSGVVNLPVLGRVAAGYPMLAVEDIQDAYPVPADMLSGEEGFMLRVRGESMIDDGILDGDFVIVRQQESAENGDTVVAMVEDEATVKRFYKEKDQIKLQPANATMQPMYFPTVRLVGKVVGLMRRMV
jgi:repressor LexA